MGEGTGRTRGIKDSCLRVQSVRTIYEYCLLLEWISVISERRLQSVQVIEAEEWHCETDTDESSRSIYGAMIVRKGENCTQIDGCICSNIQ